MELKDFYPGQKVRSINNIHLKEPYTVVSVDPFKQTVDVTYGEPGPRQKLYTMCQIYCFAPWGK